MLKQHNQLVVSLMVLADACAVAVAWVSSFWIRFTWLPVDPAKGVPEFTATYLAPLPLVLIAHLLIFSRLGLYRPRRDRPVSDESRDIVKAFPLAVVAVILIDYLLPHSNKISRQFIVTYAVVGTTCFAMFRAAVRAGLHAVRRRGWNRRTAAIVGTGRAAQQLLHALRRNSWTGIEVRYFVGQQNATEDGPAMLCDIPIRAPLNNLRQILEAEPVDAVFIALPAGDAYRVNHVLTALETSLADVRLVPEISPTFTMRPNVTELDGVPILSLRQTPLYGWNAVAKRAFDLLFGSICLLIALPLMLVIAIAIKLTSRGPVFYRQRRVGFDGREFTLIKFRTMIHGAENETGPVWAVRDDARRTRLGAFLRRTSLDELPNLFNVLAGQMSLVGPRPERPELIERFKDEIPRYMLRHKIKAGMTGYAQIKGLRGNTSLKRRVQHDVHYIRNWSLGLDLRILARTLTTAWFSKHET